MPTLQALFFVAVVAMFALVFGAPAEREILEPSQPKETLKTANSYGYGYGFGGYGGYPYGYGGYHGLYGWGKQTGYKPLRRKQRVGQEAVPLQVLTQNRYASSLTL
jgi:hypothetical protein